MRSNGNFGRAAPVAGMLDELTATADEGSTVTVGELVEAFNYRGYGPLLLVPALLELSPLGAIPAVPTILAAIVVLFSAQILLGRRHMWLPEFARRQTIASGRIDKAAEKLCPLTRWLDRWFHGRLPALTGMPATRLAAACCILLSLSVPPLELVPFASSIPMAAIAMFGLAMTVRDGLLMILGFALTGVAVVSALGFLA